MDKETADRLHALRDLVAEAVHAAVNETERTQAAIARGPYAVLERITPIAAPVRAVEFVQKTITGAVYRTIRAATCVADHAALHIVTALDSSPDRDGKR